MNTAYLLTGGNLGDRIKNLHDALTETENKVGAVIRKSSIYETAAWGVTEQPSFLNQVIYIQTQLQAEALLHTILEIEKGLGRKRLQKMGPRTIDIDILFYNNNVISTPELVVPHPRLHERLFVLTPLNEIAPELIHPQFHKTVNQLLSECPDKLEVQLFLKA